MAKKRVLFLSGLAKKLITGKQILDVALRLVELVQKIMN